MPGSKDALQIAFYYERFFCTIPNSVAGTAFLFGTGIYCGTFLLGTNFIYRLMFLLLCLPQLRDWLSVNTDDRERKIEVGLFATILAALWLHGEANGHSTFLLVPQLIDWVLFFGLAAVLMSNLLKTAVLQLPGRSPHRIWCDCREKKLSGADNGSAAYFAPGLFPKRNLTIEAGRKCPRTDRGYSLLQEGQD